MIFRNLFHTSENDFFKFQEKGKYFPYVFLSSKPMVIAPSYKYIYICDVKLNNYVLLDANGQSWDELLRQNLTDKDGNLIDDNDFRREKFDGMFGIPWVVWKDIYNDDYDWEWDEISELMKKHFPDLDGVIIKNIKETFDYVLTDDYCVFDGRNVIIKKKIINESYDKNISHILKEEINNYLILEINAYHASGTKFKKFNKSFENSGEGSQSFGPGHYFTGSKRIGKDYVNGHPTSSNFFGDSKASKFQWNEKSVGKGELVYDIMQELRKPLISVVGRQFDTDEEQLQRDTLQIIDMADNAKNLIFRLYKYFSRYLDVQNRKKEDYDDISEWFCQDAKKDMLKMLQDSISDNRRYLYQVQIPDSKEYFDWNSTKLPNGMVDKTIQILKDPKYMHYFSSRKFKNPSEAFSHDVDYYTEHGYMFDLENYLRCLNSCLVLRTDVQDVFEKTLKSFGYKGVKYPAGQNYQTSSTKKGDMNYTVFDDNDIKITNRWDY